MPRQTGNSRFQSYNPFDDRFPGPDTPSAAPQDQRQAEAPQVDIRPIFNPLIEALEETPKMKIKSVFYSLGLSIKSGKMD